MNRSLPALAALLVFAAGDRSDPPVNQVSIDINAADPAPEPANAAVEEVANVVEADNAAAPVPTSEMTALPAVYHGVFDQTTAACASASSIYRLTVSGKELRFHESLADVKSVTPDGDNAVRVAASYSGEGMTWSNIQRVALSDGGRKLTITGEGEPVARVRCG